MGRLLDVLQRALRRDHRVQLLAEPLAGLLAKANGRSLAGHGRHALPHARVFCVALTLILRLTTRDDRAVDDGPGSRTIGLPHRPVRLCGSRPAAIMPMAILLTAFECAPVHKKVFGTIDYKTSSSPFGQVGLDHGSGSCSSSSTRPGRSSPTIIRARKTRDWRVRRRQRLRPPRRVAPPAPGSATARQRKRCSACCRRQRPAAGAGPCTDLGHAFHGGALPGVTRLSRRPRRGGRGRLAELRAGGRP